MSLSDVHRRLADLIDRVETSDVRVTAASPDGSTADGTVTAELTVELSVAGDASLGTTEGDTDTTTGDPNTNEQVGAAATAATTTEPAERTAEPPAEDDGETTADEPVASEEQEPEREQEQESVSCKHDACDATFETQHGMKIHYTKTHVGSDAAMPAYRDPERLREAYEEHETLTGVKEALDADVAVTTIRRHLLEHGIHDPDAANDGSTPLETDDDGGDAVAEPTDDGDAPVGADTTTSDTEPATDTEPAPDSDEESEANEPTQDPVFPSDTEVVPGVTVDTFREALHGATTVSGVQRALDLDRETTVELLREYDLLDVVGGRVASKPDHDTVRAEVDDRLRSRLTA